MVVNSKIHVSDWLTFALSIVNFVFVFLYLKIYLNTVAIQQVELIFNGPCNYNKNIQFRKNVKPITDQLHAMLDTYYNLNYNNYIAKYQYTLIYLDILCSSFTITTFILTVLHALVKVVYHSSAVNFSPEH